MKILESLRDEPYKITADREYYDKGYRALVGVPGRVVQAKELSALSLYPIFSLDEFATELFSEGIVQGFGVSNDSKISNGSVFGIAIDSFNNIADLRLYNIDEAGNETEEFVDFDDLNPPVNDPDEDKEPEDQIVYSPQFVEENSEYNVEVIPHTGDNKWPTDIII